MDKVKYDDLDIIDLVKYIAIKKGVITKKNKSEKEKFEILDDKINLKKKTLFILVDGLGFDIVNNLKSENLLKEHLISSINTVIPTSTACVLTSIATLKYPYEHGIFGWWGYSKKLDLNYNSILCTKRDSNEYLDKIEEKEVYKYNSIFDEFSSKVSVIMNKNIINSTYSKYFAGKRANRYGYSTLKEAFLIAKEKLNDSNENFVYLYIDKYDLLSHEFGINSFKTNEVIEDVENNIKKLLAEDITDLNIVITADHGQIVSDKMIYLNKDFDFSKYFYAIPSIDTRIISFFVKPNFKGEFEKKFKEEFENDVLLLKKEDAILLDLFGETKLSKRAEDAIGEYIAIMKNNKYLICDKNDCCNIKGNHSGILNEEIKIPLIVI